MGANISKTPNPLDLPEPPLDALEWRRDAGNSETQAAPQGCRVPGIYLGPGIFCWKQGIRCLEIAWNPLGRVLGVT